MDWTWKKTFLVLGLFVAIFLLPFFLVSNTMMEYYQERIDRDPDSDFSKDLQMTRGNVCLKTWRPEMAADSYRLFLERYPEDERRPEALLNYGLALEDSNRTADAIDVFEQFLDEYPEDAGAATAKDAIQRIKYLRPKR